MGLLIQDGYTLDGVVPKKGRLPEVRYRYRPALAEDVFGYLSAPKDTGKQAMTAAADFLTKHLVSWDVADEKGEALPVTKEALRRVPHLVLRQMVDTVMGYGQDSDAQEADVKN